MDSGIKPELTPNVTNTKPGNLGLNEEVPSQYKAVDFNNFSYPVRWKNQTIRLKDGRAEFFEDKVFGNAWFVLKSVNYIDLTGDGTKEALVELNQVFCGGSCDGGSALFYFYSSIKQRPVLISRIETGSLAYTCGLKSFILEGQTLKLEVFRRCSFDGTSLKSAYDADERGGKFIADEVTQFVLHFNGRRFIVKSRAVVSNPQVDVKNYQPTITFND